jgi:plasmid stability protein
MAQFVVRDLEEDVKTRLQKRAAQRGRSLEAEVRDILRDAVKDDDASSRALGSRIASRFTGLRLKKAELAVLPPRKLKPARLGK